METVKNHAIKKSKLQRENIHDTVIKSDEWTTCVGVRFPFLLFRHEKKMKETTSKC